MRMDHYGRVYAVEHAGKHRRADEIEHAAQREVSRSEARLGKHAVYLRATACHHCHAVAVGSGTPAQVEGVAFASAPRFV